MNRRSALSFLALGAAASAGLSGCGFALRQPPKLVFTRVQLTGFAPNSPLAAELARSLENTGVTVVDRIAPPAGGASGVQLKPDPDVVVLKALSDKREQVVATKTSYSQVRELTLRTRFKFQLSRSGGGEIIAPTELLLSRELTYNEADALAKQDETEALHRAMQTDIVQQVIRRLGAVRAEQLVAPVDSVQAPALASSNPR